MQSEHTIDGVSLDSSMLGNGHGGGETSSPRGCLAPAMTIAAVATGQLPPVRPLPLTREFSMADYLRQIAREKRMLAAIKKSGKKWSFQDAEYFLSRYFGSFSRLPELIEIRRKMTVPDWWMLLGREWPGFDSMFEHKDLLRQMLRLATRSNLKAMMGADEHSEHVRLPEILTVYRGGYSCNADGLSWSLSRSIAVKFAKFSRYQRSGDVPLLMVGTTKKAGTVLLLDRNDQTIIAPDAIEVGRYNAETGAEIER